MVRVGPQRPREEKKLILILSVCYTLHRRCITLSITLDIFNVANYILCVLAMFVHFILLLLTY
jgi:hypothetical protein